MSYQNRTSLGNRPPVRTAMGGPSGPAVEVVGRPSCELLIGLYAAMSPGEPRDRSWVPPTLPPAVRAATSPLGDDAGELWLHLLGLALEQPGSIVDVVAATPADELRRHLVGVHVPAWRELVGAETLAAAAAGDADAGRTLLAHPRYYGGRAEQSLAALLPLDAETTKTRVLAALTAFSDDVFAAREEELARTLRDEAAEKNALVATLTPEEVIDRAARGYRYVREPEVSRVVLVPHLAARPWLLLCQHRDARVICYALDADAGDPAQRLLALGRALGDEKRLGMLMRLQRGDATLQELAEESGLARSTTHHHLSLLRQARLVALSGNARGYAYTLDPSGFREVEQLLARFAG